MIVNVAGIHKQTSYTRTLDFFKRINDEQMEGVPPDPDVKKGHIKASELAVGDIVWYAKGEKMTVMEIRQDIKRKWTTITVIGKECRMNLFERRLTLKPDSLVKMEGVEEVIDYAGNL